MVGYPKILYDNRFIDAVPVASSTAAGNYNVLNLRDWRPYTWWKPSAIPANVTVDSGSSKARDFFFVAGEAGTYEARGSTDNFAASNVLLATIVLAAAGMALVTFASQSHRYTRLRIPSGAAPAASIAAIGSALDFTRRLMQGFDPTMRQTEGQVNRSMKGHPLGSSIDFESWESQLQFRKVTWAWLRATFLPAWKAHLRGQPFAFAWDPVDHAAELYLVQSDGRMATPTQSGEFADLAFKVSALALP